jgi:L-alanine-DL-glutamate epimerase-like enolase superfamily enzyme
MSRFTDLWPRLAALPLTVDRHAYEPLAASGSERVTTHIRLHGAGEDGLGEDIGGFVEHHEALRAHGPALPLAGEWTLERFCDHLATLEHWPSAPEWEAAPLYRSWAYESAALDLALRQAGRALHEALGLEPRPVRFVNSFGLGEPPDPGAVDRRLAAYPGLRFKLDAAPSWSRDVLAALAATAAVDTIDFKGRYGLPVEDVDALLAMYDGVLDAFADAILEDPHDLPLVTALLEPYSERVSYDAPIHTAADLDATPLRARIVNVKPSRTGGLRALLGIYEHCERHGIRMYGGGMGELGVGRGQVQLLASLFHADAPNDVAPSAFNLPEAPAGLPSSPLAPRPQPSGFRWDGATPAARPG